MKVYFYLHRARQNKKGKCPIVCRVSASDTLRHDFRTLIFIEPERWDNVRGLPTDNHESILTRLNNITNALYRLISLGEEGVTPTEIVDRYRQPAKAKPTTLAQVEKEMFERKMYNENVRIRMAPGIKQFIAFTRNLSLSKVTQEHAEAFYRHMLKTNTDYTVDKKMQHIKRLFTYAKNNGYIQQSPFVNYVFPSLRRLEPEYLTDQELHTLSHKTFKVARLEYIRDLFVFQCHTGFAYKDIFAFSKDLVTESNGVKYLDGKRQKNGSPFYLPFYPEAERIAEKYNYNFQNKSNQKYNSYLKEIADLCEIQKNLTSHVGRKTFAQRMVDIGYSAETISKMMGHASFDMTQKHYARISEKRIETEYWRLNAA
jgi:integrase/recombinase XerD